MTMYVTVRYGEGQEHIFNPNCRSVALLRNIRDRCLPTGCPPSPEEELETNFATDIDLSDESGNIKFLRDTPFRYANEVLNDRECLILLRVDKHDGAYASYTPLLKDDQAITEDFMARLCVRDEADGRPESSRRVKSNTRRSPAEKDKDGRKGKGDRNRNLKPGDKNVARSRSRGGNRQ